MMAGRADDPGWWLKEARMSADDGHPDAARYAYAEAIRLLPEGTRKDAAIALFNGLPGSMKWRG